MTVSALPHEGGFGAVGAPRAMPLLEQRIISRRRHHARTGAVDAAIITAAVAATAALEVSRSADRAGVVHIVFGAIVLGLVWALSLSALRREAHRRGAGERLELLPILHSAMIGIAALAILAGVTGWAVLTPHVALTLPACVSILVTVRVAQHAWWSRPGGHATLDTRTLVVGSPAGVAHTIQSLRGSRSGHRIVGVVVVDGEASDHLMIDGTRVAILGAGGDVAQIARDQCIETVIVAGGASDDPDYVRRLSWSLEGASTDLVLATRLSDVAQSRIRFDRAQSLALIRVSLPRFDRSTMRAKRRLDAIVAALALIPIGLITPMIALAIVLDSPGAVFFRQRRIGRDGREFDILKFRTMGTDAEARRGALEKDNEGSWPLFKLRNDPRVTRVGAILRRWSLDELPQFWNVLMGEMSVVGPRPPLPEEVRAYDSEVLRRLYVQPGITGLWQVSGRSDLSWAQSVRLDLHYVENWSVGADLKIMLRTAAVMARPKGAY